ncbi:hypothetical protein D3C85_1815420 [compost metagenome]
MNKSDSLTLCHGTKITMIGNDRSDFHIEVALTAAIKQVIKTVVEFRNHDHGSYRLRRIMNFPVHFQAIGHFSQAVAKIHNLER